MNEWMEGEGGMQRELAGGLVLSHCNSKQDHSHCREGREEEKTNRKRIAKDPRLDVTGSGNYDIAY